MENKNQPAFPTPEIFIGEPDGSTTVCPASIGLTKREHFAGLAMQGILASETEAHHFLSAEARVQYAIEHADALLKALEP